MSDDLEVVETAKDRLEQRKKIDMIQALEITRGIVTPAAKTISISRTTHYRWLVEDPEYAYAVANLKDLALDHVESKLIDLIDGVTVQEDGEDGPTIYTRPPSVAAAIFYLKTQGQARGYIEKQQIDMNVTKKHDIFPGIDLTTEDVDYEEIPQDDSKDSE